MPNEVFYFILGTALSVPINVFSPFITDRLKQFLSTRSTPRAHTRRDQLEQQLSEARDYAADHQKFTSFLLSRILMLLLIATAVAVIPGVLYTLSSLISGVSSIPPSSNDYQTQIDSYVTFRQIDAVSSLISATGSLLGVIGSAVVVQYGVQAWRRLWRVRNLERFEKLVAAQLEALQGGSSVDANEPSLVEPSQKMAETFDNTES